MMSDLGTLADPAVSILLPVHNGARYVAQAIDSVLAQSFTDFELIVIDDGSTDATPDIVRRYADERIRRIIQGNQGLPLALNRGLELARGRFIGRQDHDDLSLPERLAKQVRFLSGHDDVGLVGTWADIWREDSKTGRMHAHPSQSSDLKYQLLFDNPFVHSSVLVRKIALDRVGSYSTDPKRVPPEDYELWSRIAREFEVANLPEVLQIYREVDGSISRLGTSPFRDHLITISTENIAWAAGVASSDNDAINIAALVHHGYDRIRHEPDFDAMRETLRRAARRVAPNDIARLLPDVDRSIATLQDRWISRLYSGGRRRRVSRALRRIANLTRRS
jgi:hypothetical protein